MQRKIKHKNTNQGEFIIRPKVIIQSHANIQQADSLSAVNLYYNVGILYVCALLFHIHPYMAVID
jgi:hypothetical protein